MTKRGKRKQHDAEAAVVAFDLWTQRTWERAAAANRARSVAWSVAEAKMAAVWDGEAERARQMAADVWAVQQFVRNARAGYPTTVPGTGPTYPVPADVLDRIERILAAVPAWERDQRRVKEAYDAALLAAPITPAEKEVVADRLSRMAMDMKRALEVEALSPELHGRTVQEQVADILGPAEGEPSGESTDERVIIAGDDLGRLADEYRRVGSAREQTTTEKLTPSDDEMAAGWQSVWAPLIPTTPLLEELTAAPDPYGSNPVWRAVNPREGAIAFNYFTTPPDLRWPGSQPNPAPWEAKAHYWTPDIAFVGDLVTTGIRVTYACGSQTIIPARTDGIAIPSAILHAPCPGCGAEPQTFSAVERAKRT